MTVKIHSKNGKFEYDITPDEHFLLLTVGIAMMRLQHFESLLVTILGSLDKSAGSLTLDNIDTIFGKLGKVTLGQLNALMSKKVHGDELHAQLRKLKDGRNFIAHHSLKGYAGMEAPEMVAMGLKINEVIDLADEVQNFLIKELSEQNVTHISEIYLEFDEDGKVTKIEDVA